MIKFILWPSAILVLFLGFLYTQGRLDQISRSIKAKSESILLPKTSENDCGDECKRKIEEEVTKKVAEVTGNIGTTQNKPTGSQPTKKQTSYISLDGTGSTTGTDWIDVPGVEVAFDLVQDFGKEAMASWEISLKVADGNGQAFARLFDVTNGIAVAQSEISTVDNSAFKRVNSGYLNLWSGRNVYRVQIRSLNTFRVDSTGAKIRISY